MHRLCLVMFDLTSRLAHSVQCSARCVTGQALHSEVEQTVCCPLDGNIEQMSQVEVGYHLILILPCRHAAGS